MMNEFTTSILSDREVQQTKVVYRGDTFSLITVYKSAELLPALTQTTLILHTSKEKHFSTRL